MGDTKDKREPPQEPVTAALFDDEMAEDAAEAETMLRIIQSIPSPKAEPIKQWLARVGTERLAEIDNPALAIERARMEYLQKGYSDEWIEKLYDYPIHSEGRMEEIGSRHWR